MGCLTSVMPVGILERFPPGDNGSPYMPCRRHRGDFYPPSMLWDMKKAKFDSRQNIFALANEEDNFKSSPLSVRMRPQSFDQYVGQSHILGEGKLLTRAVEADRLSSVIFYGPPGIGKTTLAHCISKKTKAHFERLNAVSSNVEELRKVILSAQNRRATTQQKTILFYWLFLII